MYVEKKRIGNKHYFYLKASMREQGKVKTKTIAYLGTNEPSKEEISKAIEKAQFPKQFGEPGDIISLVTKEGEEIKGTVIPSFDSKILFLKLKSGYNIGIETESIKEIKKTGK